MKTFESWWACPGDSISAVCSRALPTPKDLAQVAWDARVPEGYIVVPREPTEKMLRHAYPHTTPRAIYRSMVEAAEGEKK